MISPWWPASFFLLFGQVFEFCLQVFLSLQGCCNRLSYVINVFIKVMMDTTSTSIEISTANCSCNVVKLTVMGVAKDTGISSCHNWHCNWSVMILCSDQRYVIRRAQKVSWITYHWIASSGWRWTFVLWLVPAWVVSTRFVWWGVWSQKSFSILERCLLKPGSSHEYIILCKYRSKSDDISMSPGCQGLKQPYS